MGLFDNLANAVGSALGNSGEKNADGSDAGAGAQDILGNLLKQGGLGQSGGIIGDLLSGFGGHQSDAEANAQGNGAGGGLLGSVLQSLASGGLGEQVASWISNNPNLPISPEQIREALGSEQVQQMAQQSGLPINDFLQDLARHLPQAASAAAGVAPGGTSIDPSA